MDRSSPLPARLWTAFRGLPTAAQVALWVLLAPFVAALLLASTPRVHPVRYGLATLVLVAGVGAYAGAGTDGAADRLAAEQAAQAAELAAEEDAAAAERARADAEAARADAEAARADAEAARAAEEAAERRAARDAAAEERRAEREAAAAEERRAREAAEAEVAAAGDDPVALTWTVTNVVDGDTIDVRGPDGTEERVRVAGIDTPERGDCGFGPATSAMSGLVLGEQVQLVAGSRDDRDRYGRIIRYVDVAGVDAGLELIERGLAIARYDSRDGYGRHDREQAYVAADAASSDPCAGETRPAPDPAPSPAPATPPPSTSGGPGSGPGGAWRNCTEAREAGAAPVLRGTPGYGRHLDRDDDGIGCE